jgi:cystine transport system permease protein
MDRWQLALDSWWPLVWSAITGTIPLTLLSFALGLVLALLVALARLSSNKALNLIGQFYVSVIRGTPLLVQLFIIFYALPFLGVTLPPFPSAVIAFSANVGGYAAETIRGAILAVPRGQWEAAATVGLDYWLTLRRVVLPQAFRIAVPPLSNTFISLVKDTSLASIVMVTELLRRAQIIATPTYDFLTMYTEAAVIYWIICSVLSFAQKRMEVYFSKYVTV